MDFLKDIVKEIGDDFTKSQVVYLAVYLGIRLLLLLESLLLERLFSLSQWLRIFLILIPMVTVSTLTLRLLSLNL
jgi:hypothetical protein